MKRRAIFAAAAAPLLLPSCQSVDSERLPSMPVNISLADPATWNTYGVAGYGAHRCFILASGLREPAAFPFSLTSATGFGGVLLINGMDPFTAATDTPLAYDLACPVERKSDVRIYIDSELSEAVCPGCGSRYDVTMGGGAPLAGPAASGSSRFGLTRYRCLPSSSGGYIITN